MGIEAAVEQVPVAVGRRVREARLERDWTLDRLAEASGVSRRMIVNVESGSSNASITTLLRLAEALRVTLADLVGSESGSRRLAVTGPTDREVLWRGEFGGSAVMVASADTPDMLELWDWLLEPGEAYASEPHRRGTHELLYVISGQLTLTADGETARLRNGDAARLFADVVHEYRNEGRHAVRFTMTVLEPMTRVRP